MINTWFLDGHFGEQFADLPKMPQIHSRNFCATRVAAEKAYSKKSDYPKQHSSRGAMIFQDWLLLMLFPLKPISLRQ